MTAYSPPLEGRDPGAATLLDFNESIRPPSQAVRDALHRFVDGGRLQVYPEYRHLEQRLASHHGIEPEQLLLTNGSDQGIDVVLRALLDAGDTLVLPKPTFAMFAQVAGTLDVVVRSPRYGPRMEYPLDEVRALLAGEEGVRPSALVIVNPNNPTGTALPLADLASLLEAFPDVAVLVDEAYAEFTGESVVPWVSDYPNLAVLRTFSKAYAIPSLRLGFVAADARFITELLKIRGPYDVNMMAVVAAEAHMDEPDGWVDYVREIMEESKPRIEAFLRDRGVEFFPGAANFMLVRPDDVGRAVDYLKGQRILVRPQRAPLDDMFRLSVGPVEAMERFMEAYGRYLESRPAA